MTSVRTRTVLALTLACTPLLIATTAHADTACGTPAVEAVYDTVHTDAVTHLELKWSTTVVDSAAVPAWSEPDVVVPATYKTVTVVDREAWDETVVDKEAWDETIVDKEAWVETVVDQPAYDRYVVTQQALSYRVNQWRYRNIFGNTLYYEWWRDGTRPSGSGWSLTGNWYWVDEPQQGYWETVPAVTHTVDHPAESHVVTHEAETHVVNHPEVNHEEQVVDVAEHTVPGEHHDAVEAVTHQEYQWAVASPGDAWVQTQESRVVIDAAATDTQTLVTPAVPAGDVCETPADPSAGGAGDGDAGDGDAGDGGKGSGPAVLPVKAPAAAPAASAVPALAHTGADGTTELLALGGLLVLAGAGLRRAVRQRG